MSRVNIFLGDDLLQELDEEAQRQGVKRSALFREALERYLETLQQTREEEAAQRRMKDACRKMDAIAERLGDWDAVGTVRKFRDSRLEGASATERPDRKRRKS